MKDKFSWFASENGEDFTVGPCETKEQAIDEALENELGLEWNQTTEMNDYSFEVVEACYHDPLKLSDFFDVENFIYDAYDSVADQRYENDEDLFFISDEQSEELSKSVKQAIDVWQNKHNLVFQTHMFKITKNREIITGVLK